MIGGVIVSLVVLYVLFSIVGWIIALLYKWLAWPLLIAALVIDHRVVLNYFTGIKNLFASKPLFGLGAVALTVIFYPFVFLYFLGMALFRRKVKEVREEAEERQHGKWTDYEEISEKPLDIDTHYEVLPPPPEPRNVKRGEEGYDEYFK